MNKENEPGEGKPAPRPSGDSDAANAGSFSLSMFDKARAWHCAKMPVLKFVLVLAGLMAGYYAATLTPWFQERFFPVCMRLNALLSNVLLNGLGQGTTAIGTSVFSQRFAVDVRRGCDAIEPAVLFVSAVLSFPSPLRRRVAGALIGTFLLLALNLVRIVTLFLIGVYYPQAFHAMHAEVWQIVFILLAVVLWALWIQWSARRPGPAPNAAS
jgi:exosortase/archaeosortase family protein